MAEDTKPESTPESTTEETAAPIAIGPVSSWLTENGFDHKALEPDHLNVETIEVEADFLIPLATALYAHGFNQLSCQGAYDLGPGQPLVSFYHLIEVGDDITNPREVRLKVFLPRDNPVVPSVYWIWKGADWQERESYDMYGIIYEGHPELKRLLMPEDWVGWPLRKDYVSPDFYELQDAY